MYITAQEIGAPGRAVHRSVGAALAANPGYSIDITGPLAWRRCGIRACHDVGRSDDGAHHSFIPPACGASTARVLLCCACVTSAALGKKVSSIITSFTYSYDLVCRLSLGSIQDIRNGSAWLCYQDKMAAHGDGTMNALMKRAFEYQSGRMQEVASKETEHEMLVLRARGEYAQHPPLPSRQGALRPHQWRRPPRRRGRDAQEAAPVQGQGR
ncbi:hypothetical protein L1887_61331 [Cichorium endivia]|nr:hypothetical protein L1887_61331 [Cichorium endivia]